MRDNMIICFLYLGYRRRLVNTHREDIKYPDLDLSLPKEPQKVRAVTDILIQ
jgi:hypothetical protein